MELQHLIAEDNRMAGVVSSLKPGHPRGLLRKPVNEFPFAFIAPLGA
jgi:hypothetical protein